jgi:hypothetical protein
MVVGVAWGCGWKSREGNEHIWNLFISTGAAWNPFYFIFNSLCTSLSEYDVYLHVIVLLTYLKILGISSKARHLGEWMDFRLPGGRPLLVQFFCNISPLPSTWHILTAYVSAWSVIWTLKTFQRFSLRPIICSTLPQLWFQSYHSFFSAIFFFKQV